MPAGTEILFGGEYLAYGDAVITEQFVISVDEFGLSYSENNWRWSTLSSFLRVRISLRPEATAPKR